MSHATLDRRLRLSDEAVKWSGQSTAREDVLPITAIESRRLYRRIADQLRELIERGEYAAGGRLPAERDLAEALGVSRPSVREALIALEVEGRVRISMGSGVYVADPGPVSNVPRHEPAPEGAFEVLGAREIVEPAIAAEAARSGGDVAGLDEVLAQVEECRGPNTAFVAFDRRFHVGLAGMTGNPVIVRLVGELFDKRIHPYFAQLARYFETPHTWRAALSEHRAIRDAVAAHDPLGAAQAMRTHLQRSQERFSTSFEGFGDGHAASTTTGRQARPVRTSKGRKA